MFIIYAAAVIAILAIISLAVLLYNIIKGNTLNVKMTLSVFASSALISLMFPTILGFMTDFPSNINTAFAFSLGILLALVLTFIIYIVLIFLLTLLISTLISEKSMTKMVNSMGNTSFVQAVANVCKSLSSKVNGIFANFRSKPAMAGADISQSIENQIVPDKAETDNIVTESTDQPVLDQTFAAAEDVSTIHEENFDTLQQSEPLVAVENEFTQKENPNIDDFLAAMNKNQESDISEEEPIYFQTADLDEDAGQGKNILEKSVDSEQNIDTMGIENVNAENAYDIENNTVYPVMEEAVEEDAFETLLNEPSDVSSNYEKFETDVDYFTEGNESFEEPLAGMENQIDESAAVEEIKDLEAIQAVEDIYPEIPEEDQVGLQYEALEDIKDASMPEVYDEAETSLEYIQENADMQQEIEALPDIGDLALEEAAIGNEQILEGFEEIEEPIAEENIEVQEEVQEEIPVDAVDNLEDQENLDMQDNAFDESESIYEEPDISAVEVEPHPESDRVEIEEENSFVVEKELNDLPEGISNDYDTGILAEEEIEQAELAIPVMADSGETLESDDVGGLITEETGNVYTETEIQSVIEENADEQDDLMELAAKALAEIGEQREEESLNDGVGLPVELDVMQEEPQVFEPAETDSISEIVEAENEPDTESRTDAQEATEYIEAAMDVQNVDLTETNEIDEKDEVEVDEFELIDTSEPEFDNTDAELTEMVEPETIEQDIEGVDIEIPEITESFVEDQEIEEQPILEQAIEEHQETIEEQKTEIQEVEIEEVLEVEPDEAVQESAAIQEPAVEDEQMESFDIPEEMEADEESITEAAIEEDSEAVVKDSEIAVEKFETDVNTSIEVSLEDYIEMAFKMRSEGNYEGAIQNFMQAMSKNPDKNTMFMMVLDICSMYKELGQEELARFILGSYVEGYGDTIDASIRLEIERNLL